MDDNGFIIKDFFVDDVPVITCVKTGVQQKPLLIFSHEFRSKKEFFLEEMKFFAGHDFFTIAVDNKHHGMRKEPPFAAMCMEDGKFNVLKIRKIINDSAYDIPKIIDYLINTENLDITRIGLYGISMGGYIAFKVLTMDDRVSFAALFISSPYWNDIPPSDFFLNNETIRKDLEEYAATESPASAVEKIKTCKILLQNGAADTHFNINKVKNFVALLQNGKNTNLDFFEYAGVKHEVTEEMKLKARSWIFRTIIKTGKREEIVRQQDNFNLIKGGK